MIEEVRDSRIEGGEGLLAIVIRKDQRKNGVNFVTDRDAELQVALIKHPCGHEVVPHRHLPASRTLKLTQEVLVVQKGFLLARFYASDGRYVDSKCIGPNEVVLLISGGHGFVAETDVEFVEVKTGPYLGALDKCPLSVPFIENKS